MLNPLNNIKEQTKGLYFYPIASFFEVFPARNEEERCIVGGGGDCRVLRLGGRISFDIVARGGNSSSGKSSLSGEGTGQKFIAVHKLSDNIISQKYVGKTYLGKKTRKRSNMKTNLDCVGRCMV